MIHAPRRLLTIPLIVLFGLLTTLGPMARPAFAATARYVATNGNDANPGTLSQPYRTIQRCASVAVAGDTCYVRAGTYRETVVPTNSGTAAAPITFQPYNNEAVTINGADTLTGWTQHSGAIYKAPLGWDLGRGSNQVFLDGTVLTEARFPNLTGTISQPNFYTITGGTRSGTSATVTINDSARLTQPANTWVGATINIKMYSVATVAQSGLVTSSGGGGLTFTLDPDRSEAFLRPYSGNPYFLSGIYAALDTGGEWVRQSDGNLYLWAPAGDNPAGHTVEVKRRLYGFDLSGRSYINLQGFKLFATTIKMSSTSTHNILDGLDARYLSNYWVVLGDSFESHANDTGIIINGSDNILRNSRIAYSSGNGVSVLGYRQLVQNNIIHDTGYVGHQDGIGTGIRPTDGVPANDTDIRYNTVYNTARFGIATAIGGSIDHNDISAALLQTDDGGGIYGYRANGQQSEIAYNRIHDIDTSSAQKHAIYLDGLYNYVVHHNVTWNVNTGILLNPNPELAAGSPLDNKIYNNTLGATNRSIRSNYTSTDWSRGIAVRNNIFRRLADTGGTVSNNLASTTDPLFVNPAANNFQLQQNSPAINAGAAIAPYTNGFVGPAPDIGAYEYGATAWSAGANLTMPPAATATPTTPPSGPTATPSPTPGGGGTLTVDNAVLGTGLNQFSYSGTWSNCTSCAGNYLNTVSYSDVTNNSVSFAFNGTKIELYGNTWGGVGAVSIDGGAETNVNFSTSNTLKYTSPTLSAGNHTLTVRVTGQGGSTGNKSVVIDYVVVTSGASATPTSAPTSAPTATPTPASVTTIDDNVQGSGQNQFSYSGSWSNCTSCAGNYLNTVSYSNVTNNTVSLSFSGTRLRIYGNTWGGIGAVSIDGGAETNVDFGTATTLKWTSPTLSAGSHTVTIRVTGNLGVGTNRSVVLDYVEVTP